MNKAISFRVRPTVDACWKYWTSGVVFLWKHGYLSIVMRYTTRVHTFVVNI